eukprot:TRINITY_DN14398_c0_g2_i2.p1 TRINITY_DN14398_c0_g2~~TRINITY_DN14398_c0_g2_i2.p1  ORF type:complete len:113 (-),score=6.43 TRINITY_DN14398_c0_g2_i2:460-798(-)
MISSHDFNLFFCISCRHSPSYLFVMFSRYSLPSGMHDHLSLAKWGLAFFDLSTGVMVGTLSLSLFLSLLRFLGYMLIGHMASFSGPVLSCPSSLAFHSLPSLWAPLYLCSPL